MEPSDDMDEEESEYDPNLDPSAMNKYAEPVGPDMIGRGGATGYAAHIAR
jgi:hypothetical protein